MNISYDERGEVMLFCTKCGNELVDGASFCTKCGTKIDPELMNNSVKQNVSAVHVQDRMAEINQAVENEPSDGNLDFFDVDQINQAADINNDECLEYQNINEESVETEYAISDEVINENVIDQQNVFQQGYQQGYQQGSQYGQQLGFQHGNQRLNFQQAYQQSYQQVVFQLGNQPNYQQNYFEQGYQQGYLQGFQQGYQLGYQQGNQQNMVATRNVGGQYDAFVLSQRAKKTGLASSASVFITSFLSLGLLAFILFFPFFESTAARIIGYANELRGGGSITNVFSVLYNSITAMFDYIDIFGFESLFDSPGMAFASIFIPLCAIFAILSIIFQICSIVNAIIHTPYKDYKSAKKTFGAQMFLIPVNIFLVIYSIAILDAGAWLGGMGNVLIIMLTIMVHLAFVIVVGIQRSKTGNAWRAIEYLNSTNNNTNGMQGY